MTHPGTLKWSPLAPPWQVMGWVRRMAQDNEDEKRAAEHSGRKVTVRLGDASPAGGNRPAWLQCGWQFSCRINLRFFTSKVRIIILNSCMAEQL